ncbi:MAG: dehydrogenase [Bacteroidales bacterium]|jgi:D-glycero-alpha-D-manno-heptose-7-phosphate kinase
MIIRSKAPLRLGLAGGGSDVSPYSDIHGGAILNATISMYAYSTIKPRFNEKIVIYSVDKNQIVEFDSKKILPIDGKLDLLKGVYNRIIKDFIKQPLSFELTTFVDAPPGSGLGSSSTLVVAVIGAFVEWLKLPLGEYDIAHLAYEIERIDLGMAGGKQDQYAATFGGVNYMEFYDNDKVIVNPLRIHEKYLDELSYNLILYNTETSRLSSKIIEAQVENVKQSNEKSIEAMHKVKEQSALMKEAILKGNLNDVGKLIDAGWQHKKKMAKGITNELIDEIYETAINAGANGGKVTGAGGGGFITFYCPNNSRYKVIEALKKFGGRIKNYEFTSKGLTTWSI